MKRILIAVALAVIPAMAFAQGKTLEYRYVGASLSEVSQYTQVITINDSVVPVTPVCVTKGADVQCSAPITTLSGQNNTISVTAVFNGQAAETVTNYNPTLPGPKQPSGGTIKIVVIVNLPQQ